jgi:hypothetical protein
MKKNLCIFILTSLLSAGCERFKDLRQCYYFSFAMLTLRLVVPYAQQAPTKVNLHIGVRSRVVSPSRNRAESYVRNGR